MILDIFCSYKIVEKKETTVLLKILGEIRAINDAWSVMYFPEDSEERDMVSDAMNKQVYRKLDKLFRYYERRYNVDLSTIPDEYYEAKVEAICEAIRSWEE